MQVVFIDECKSYEISNQIHFRKPKTNLLWHQYCKMKLFSGATLHDACNEPEAYLETGQKSTKERFCKNS